MNDGVYMLLVMRKHHSTYNIQGKKTKQHMRIEMRQAVSPMISV